MLPDPRIEFKRLFFVFLVVFTSLPVVRLIKTFDVSINTKSVMFQGSEKFVSLGLESEIAFSDAAMKAYSSQNFTYLAKALSPSFIRVGGDSAEEGLFNITTKQRKPQYHNEIDVTPDRNITNFTISCEKWDTINHFVGQAQYDFIFDLNAFLRNEGKWNPFNAFDLIKYTASKGYKMGGWELGNEPNLYFHYNRTVLPEQLVNDFTLLKAVLSYLPNPNNLHIIGPSVTQLTMSSAQSYFLRFMKYSGGESLTSATFHHYYIAGNTATIYQFLDPNILDSLAQNMKIGKSIMKQYASDKKLWMGETSSAYGGGAKGLSDRYVAGFMWLDKLGVAAKEGIDVVIRQSLFGLHYGLIDLNTLTPNPDFWLTLLYKKLVGSKVLSTNVSDSSGKVRVYAHCSQSIKYVPGSVTVSWMNLDTEEVQINATVFSNHPIHMYLLEPFGPDQLKSKDVSLNGVHLLQKEDGSLPDVLQPRVIQEPVTLPPLTFGFLVIPGKDVASACSKS